MGISSIVNRDKKIDIIKGIGITLMVYAHAAKYTSFIVLFHMSIFYIASGYCFNPQKVNSLKGLGKYISRKIKVLWIPYFIFNSIFVILNNFFIRTNIYTNNELFLIHCKNPITKCFNFITHKELVTNIISNALFQGDTQIGGALWFLQSLFFITVGYGIIDYILQQLFKNRNSQIIAIQGIISGLFLYIGWFCYLNNITAKHMNRVFSYYWFIWLGYCINNYHIMEKIYNKINLAVVIASAIIILTICNQFGSISLNANAYVNPIYLAIVSISGWILLYSIAYILDKGTFKIVCGVLKYFSIHSIPIIALHFLMFKIVNLIYVLTKDYPYFMIAAFPVLVYNGIWWIAYMTVGIIIPLILEKIFNIIRTKLTFNK